MEKIFSLLLLCRFFACTYAQAHASSLQLLTSPAAQSIARVVTANDYANFLNRAATNNIPLHSADSIEADHLYSEKIESDPEAACLIRVGNPGQYSYQVIAGRENFPVMYVTELNQESYCTETGFSVAEDETVNTQSILTPSLSCSRMGFMVGMKSNISSFTMFEPLAAGEGATAGEIGIDVVEIMALLLGGGIVGDRIRFISNEEISPHNEQTASFILEPSFSALNEYAEMSHNDARSLNAETDTLNHRLRQQSIVTAVDYDYLSHSAQKNQEASLKALDANNAALQKASDPDDLVRLGNNSQAAQTAAAIWAQRVEWIAFEKKVTLASTVYRRAITQPSEAAWDEFCSACTITLQAMTLADHAQRNLLTHSISAAERFSIIDQISWMEKQKLEWAQKIHYANDQKRKIIAEAARRSQITERKTNAAQQRIVKKTAPLAEAKARLGESMQTRALEKRTTENKKNRRAPLICEEATEELPLKPLLFEKKNDNPSEKTTVFDSSLTPASTTWSSMAIYFTSLSNGTKKVVYDTSLLLAQKTFNVIKGLVWQALPYIPNPITKIETYFAHRTAQQRSNAFLQHWNAALKQTDPKNPNFKTRWNHLFDIGEKAYKAWLNPKVDPNNDFVIYAQKHHELATALAKAQHASLLAKNDSMQLLSLPQNPSLQKEKEQRSVMRKIAKASQKKADDLWRELSEKATILDADIPESQRSKWNEVIAKTKHEQSLHILAPLREHATELIQLFVEKAKQISALTIDDTKLYENLAELETMTQSTVTAWKKVIDACDQFKNRDISTKYITSVYEIACYEKAYTPLEELRIKAQKKDEMAETAALLLNNLGDDKPDPLELKALQNNAMIKQDERRQAWLAFINRYNEFNNTIPESRKKFWDHDFEKYFNEAQQTYLQPRFESDR